MNLHEYQSKEAVRRIRHPGPAGHPGPFCGRGRQERREELGGPLWVVKAQVHAGGRGKGGGVKLVREPGGSPGSGRGHAGSALVTHQTGPEGLPINAVLVESGSAIERELYLSLLIDRAQEKVVFMASAAGGMDIEEVAATEPEKIFRVAVHPAAGLMPYQARKLAFGLGLEKSQIGEFTAMVQALYKLLPSATPAWSR